MTDQTLDLDEIAARAAAATPGPWGSHRDLSAVYTVQARPRSTQYGMETDGDIATLAASRSDSESYANARFIAHAREDVDALLAEVRRLRAELAAARGQAVADDTIWLERRPCGCTVSAVAAIVPGAWTLTTAEDVALHFHPTEGERRRAAEAGLTVEPVTGAQYREEFRDRWHCARHTAPAVRSAAV